MRKLLLAMRMIAPFLTLSVPALCSREHDRASDLDRKVRAFLDSHAGKRHDLNFPEVDGRLLHDIIVRNDYKRALEIGTSTGHSATWIAWAISCKKSDR